jgi:hypothetical protein
MPLDPAILGNLAAEQMNALEVHFGDEDVQIAGVISIVEVLRVQRRDAEGNPVTAENNVRLRMNIGDPFHAIGVLDQAKHQLLAGPGVQLPEE